MALLTRCVRALFKHALAVRQGCEGGLMATPMRISDMALLWLVGFHNHKLCMRVPG
jgi:hypothetical protein